MPPKKTNLASKPATSKGVSKVNAKAIPKKGATTSTQNKQQSSNKSTIKEASKPAVKKWTKEDAAAQKIQRLYRGFAAKRSLEKKKKEKQDYEDLMEQLEKEAFVKLVKMEQEKMELERQKEEEERKRKREEAKRRKRMLEAAFDGEVQEMENILREVSAVDDASGIDKGPSGSVLRARHQMNMIDCEDANGNTPLSEAASGGCVEAVTMLLNLGADPNSQGQFLRTPLYRGAFAGHLDVCQALLQFGADPRKYADDGQTPAQIASLPAIQTLLTEWNMEETDLLLEKLEKAKDKRKEEERQQRQAEMDKTGEKIDSAKKEYDQQQKRVIKLTEEWNKRINEHDTAVVEGFQKPELTIAAIKDAEFELEVAKIDLEKARDHLAKVRYELREQQVEDAQELGDTLPGMQVLVRELDDVLLRDVGNKILDSGKWPLIIDSSGQAATFLRYRDTNYIQALSPKDMETDRIRLALLGALRFGKPLVVDMMEVDMYEAVARRFNEIQSNLMETLMDKSILQEERYLKLKKESDSGEYDRTKFTDLNIKRFKFFIITKNPFPPEELIEMTFPIRIHIPT